MSSKRLQSSEFCRISQGLILKEEILFKTVEREKTTSEMQLIRGDLTTVMSFLD